ncbi:hypothetical protein [Microbacterium sp.]|uniref:hypothetical protein n=1 Tax=Microbacterium sp. TaxID=51671 RepID=UPI003A859FE9
MLAAAAVVSIVMCLALLTSYVVAARRARPHPTGGQRVRLVSMLPVYAAAYAAVAVIALFAAVQES